MAGRLHLVKPGVLPMALDADAAMLAGSPARISVTDKQRSSNRKGLGAVRGRAAKPFPEGAVCETLDDMKAPGIYTIGYGKREIEDVIALLQEHGVNFLVDVRSAPFSKFKPDFSRGPLEATLKANGIRYVFMGDLLGGRPADKDCYVDGRVDYSQVQATEFFRRGIARLRTAWQKSLRICLMCSEGRPEDCHRSKLIGQALEAQDLDVTHIDADGNLQTQAAVFRIITKGQQQLFGEALTSRKRYQVDSHE